MVAGEVIGDVRIEKIGPASFRIQWRATADEDGHCCFRRGAMMRRPAARSNRQGRERLRFCIRTTASLCKGQATRRRFDVDAFAAGRAGSVKPMAPTIRMTVPNSGLPVCPSALYKLSRFKPAFFAIHPCHAHVSKWRLPRVVSPKVSLQGARQVELESGKVAIKR